MRNYAIAALAASTLSAAFIGLAAPAVAGPSGPNNGQDTSTLESLGYTVVIDKLGTLDALQRD